MDNPGGLQVVGEGAVLRQFAVQVSFQRVLVRLEAGLVSLQASLVLLQPFGRVRQGDAVPVGLGEGHTSLLEGRGGVVEGRLGIALKAGVGAIELHEHVDGAGRHQDGGEASQGDKNACAAHSRPSFGGVCGGGLRWSANVRLHLNTPAGRKRE